MKTGLCVTDFKNLAKILGKRFAEIHGYMSIYVNETKNGTCDFSKNSGCSKQNAK